jgi:lipid A 4'-phosphatase
MSVQRPRLRGVIVILGLFGFGVGATWLLESTGTDLACAGAFYRLGGANEGWIHARELPWAVLYDYGELPGLFLLAAAAALYAGAWMGKVPSRYKSCCLVIILTVALGPGLLVNGILKNYWGRPRPIEISAFGGPLHYQKAWVIGVPGGGKSFTCGHCSMAFSLASVAAFYPYHPVLSIVALTGGIGYGIVMGIARMAQGGHFPTDVLWSGIIVLSLVAALYYLVFRIPEHDGSDAARVEDPRGEPEGSL